MLTTESAADEILRSFNSHAGNQGTGATIENGVLEIDCSDEKIATELNRRQDDISAAIYQVRCRKGEAAAIGVVSISLKGTLLYQFAIKAPAMNANAIAPKSPTLFDQLLSMLRADPADRAILFEMLLWRPGVAYLVRMEDDVAIYATGDISPVEAPEKIISDAPLERFWEPDDLEAFRQAITDYPKTDITWKARIADERGNPTADRYEMVADAKLVRFGGKLCRLVKIKSCRRLNESDRP